MRRRDRFPFVRRLMAYVVLVGLGSGDVAAEPPRTDSLGDLLPPGAVARLGTMRFRHDRRVTSVVFAPDGKTLASGGEDGTVRIWETATGRELHRSRADSERVNALAYSPDGKLLACVCAYGVLFLDPATGAKLDKFRDRNASAVSLAFAPDGKTFAMATAGAIDWWDSDALTRIRKLDGFPNGVRAVTYSPDGKTLAYATPEEVGLCNPATGKKIRKLLESGAASVVYSPDGKKVLVSVESTWLLLDAAGGKELAQGDGPLLNPPVAFSPDGRLIAAMPWPEARPNGPWLWDLSGREVREMSGGARREHAQSLAFSPDGKLLAAGGEGRVRLWNVATGKELDLPAGDAVGGHRFALSRDGKTLAALDGAGRLRLWDTASGKRLRYWETPEVVVSYLALAPDASRLVVPGRRESGMAWLQVLDVATGRRWHTGFADWVRFATFSPDGSILAVSNAEDGIGLLDAASGQSRGLFAKHLGDIIAGLFSPDGKQFVTASADHTVRIWDVAGRRECHRLKGHGGGATVSHIAFSADGTRLATGGDDGRICLWDAHIGRRLRRWGIDDEIVTCLALSPDGKTVLTNGTGNRFRLWDVETATSGAAIEGHRAAVTFASFLADGRKILTGSDDGTALIWDAAALRRPPQTTPARSDCFGDPLPPGVLARMGSIRLHQDDWIGCAAFSPDGKILASVTSRGEMEGLRLWDAATGKEIHRFPKGRHFGASQMAFSPDGSVLATLSEHAIQLWDVASGESLGTMVRESDITCFAFAPDGKTLAVVAKTIDFWDLDSGEMLRTLEKPPGWVQQLVFSTDGKTLLASAGGYTERRGARDQLVPGQISVWDVATSKPSRRFTIQGTRITLAPNGQTLLYCGEDKRFHICAATTGKEFWRVEGGDIDSLFSPDGKFLLTGNGGQPFRLHEAATGKEIRRSTRMARTEEKWFCLSPDYTILTTAGYGRIELWDVASGRQRRPFGGHRRPVACLDFAPDGRTLVSGSADGTLRLWDTATGAERHLIRGSEQVIKSVAFSLDGKTIASGDDRNVVRLWDVATGAERWRFDGPDPAINGDGVQSVAFSCDGRKLIACGGDGKVYLWDAATHKLLRQFKGFGHRVYTAAVSPDGRLLICSGDDMSTMAQIGSVIRLWDAETGRKVLEIEDEAWASFASLAISPDGKLLAASRDGSDRIDLLELATGKVLFHLDSLERVAGFSPDGRLLATTNGTLWDMSSGKKVYQGDDWPPADEVCALSPDGRMLASRNAETTIFIQPLPQPARLGPFLLHEPSSRELQSLWIDLAAADPSCAWRAMRTYIEAPQQSVAFLRTVLRPHPAINPHRLDRLLADLDSERFAVREQARNELGKLGELAETALRRTLIGKPSLEVRRRVLELLDQIEKGERAPEALRTSRVTAVLERVGTPESVKLLCQLASGAAEARLTREATAALERLKRRGIKP